MSPSFSAQGVFVWCGGSDHQLDLIGTGVSRLRCKCWRIMLGSEGRFYDRRHNLSQYELGWKTLSNNMSKNALMMKCSTRIYKK